MHRGRHKLQRIIHALATEMFCSGGRVPELADFEALTTLARLYFQVAQEKRAVKGGCDAPKTT